MHIIKHVINRTFIVVVLALALLSVTIQAVHAAEPTRIDGNPKCSDIVPE